MPLFCGQGGLWLSLVERLVRDEEAVGSNPTSPITCHRSGHERHRLLHNASIGFRVISRPAESRCTFLRNMARFQSETICHSTEAMLAFRLTPTAR